MCKIFGDTTTDPKTGVAPPGGKYTVTPLYTAANQKEPSNLYTLSFKFSLKHDKDEVYIAMCYPYTYTDMIKMVDKICAPLESEKIIRKTSLGKTIAGNSLDMLIITNFESS